MPVNQVYCDVTCKRDTHKDRAIVSKYCILYTDDAKPDLWILHIKEYIPERWLYRRNDNKNEE